MLDGISLTYHPDDDGDPGGLLVVQAAHDGFGGASEAYFTDEALTRFAEELSNYPLPDPAPRLTGGYENPVETHVLLVATQISVAGQVGIEVMLRDPNQDRPGAREVRLTVPTTYARLATFHKELRAIIGRRTIDEVVLAAEWML